jgi:hypothetical protein
VRAWSACRHEAVQIEYTGQAYAIMPIPPNSNLIALHDAQRHRKSSSAGHRRKGQGAKAGARR